MTCACIPFAHPLHVVHKKGIVPLLPSFGLWWAFLRGFCGVWGVLSPPGVFNDELRTWNGWEMLDPEKVSPVLPGHKKKLYREFKEAIKKGPIDPSWRSSWVKVGARENRKKPWSRIYRGWIKIGASILQSRLSQQKGGFVDGNQIMAGPLSSRQKRSD